MEYNFPRNLTYLLEKNIISVDKLLKITNHKSPGLVSMWKNGERKIMTPDVLKLAVFLGYTIDDLISKDISKIKPMKTHTIVCKNDIKIEIKIPEDMELTKELIEEAFNELDRQN